MTETNWAKFLVSTTLIGGGVTLLWFGIRPRTEREKREEIRESWMPEQVDLSPSQKSDVETATEKLNQLRAAIRQRWSEAPEPIATNLPPGKSTNHKMLQEVLQNSEYPWKHQELGWYRRSFAAGDVAYETDQISPYLQNAVMMVDLLLLASTNTDLPAQVSIREFIRQLDRILQNRGILEVVAAHAAREKGQWLKAQINHNYEVEREREFARNLNQNSPGLDDLDRAFMTWIALGTFLSPMSAEERQTRRALRNSPSRTPRILTL